MRMKLVGSLLFISSVVVAQTLADASDGPAIKVNDDGSYQITCVATAVYNFNDPEDILDARNMATMRAKAALTKFLTEDIASQDALERATVKTKKSSTADGIAASNESVSKTHESIRSSASALLAGVVVLQDEKVPEGDGGFCRVMVGVSSKTLRARNAVASDLASPGKSVTPSVTNAVAPVAPSVTGEPAAAPSKIARAADTVAPGLPEGWYVCVGVGDSRKTAVRAALVEGVSMVYGQVLETDERMSERVETFRAKVDFISSLSGSGKIARGEYATNMLSKTAGFVREYRIVNVVQSGDSVEATVHAHIVDPRANNIAALLIHPPKMTTKLATKLLPVGPKQKMSGAEVGELIAESLPTALEAAQRFIVLTDEALAVTLANKAQTEASVGAGIAHASELTAIGGALTPDYGLYVEVKDVNYSKKMGLDKHTQKFQTLHRMTVKLSVKVMNERMGNVLKTKQLALTLDNDEIVGLLDENEEADLISAILMKLAEPLQEMIDSTP